MVTSDNSTYQSTLIKGVLFSTHEAATQAEKDFYENVMNAANTSFMILSSILVLFMTPGLAFFYGGLVSKRNVVNTMLSVFIMTGVAIVLWWLFPR